MNKELVAKRNVVLMGEVGSTAHGTGVAGFEDVDMMGVFVEPLRNIVGRSAVDHYIQRDQPEGVKSQPGDLDLTLYSLRKFIGLAATGNPSVVVLLWLPEYKIKEDLGYRLIELRDDFITKQAGERYLGYLRAQTSKLLGQRSPAVSRPDLVAKHGYDTKFAMHALRLGLQGIELLTEHHLSIPCASPNRELLVAVRKGAVAFDEVMRLIDEAETHLRSLVNNCEATVDLEKVDDFLVQAHMSHWGLI